MIGREFGDYQTPEDFALQVCTFLKKNYNLNPSMVLEPTCGIGNLLRGSFIFNAKYYIGIEINPAYCQFCHDNLSDNKVDIINADIFKFDLNQLPKYDNTLILGNPPWITNSELSALHSNNLPLKNNFKGLKGLDALTGDSNFDLAESIIIKLIVEYHNYNAVLAMLCKTSSARRIFIALKNRNIAFTDFNMINFDAKKVFGVNVDACLMLVRLGKEAQVSSSIKVSSFNDNTTYTIDYINGQLYKSTNIFDGQCCFQWRQGIKHDCSKVMELELKVGRYINGFNESVDIENTRVFPLVKSSMFKSPIINSFSKYVIVLQNKINEPTDYVENKLPKTWNYLCAHEDIFKRRKSVIYSKAPRFSSFGIGNYSFARYKVGISGFYKEPFFSLIYSPEGKAVMTDDTTYFISFDEYDTAYTAMLYLNSIRLRDFLKSIVFLDSKRPYTKQILMRLDFAKIISIVTLDELSDTEVLLNLPPYINESVQKKFAESVHSLSDNLFSFSINY